jgi:Bacteriophage lambda head decoration protein D.
MPNVNVPYPEAGLAAFEELSTYQAGLLLSGNWPALSPGYPLRVRPGQTIEQFQVCGVDEEGYVVPAVKGTVQASLVSTQKVVADADPGKITTAPFFYSGCFNPEMLVWDASYATDEDKRSAFEGAPTPTQILIRARG